MTQISIKKAVAKQSRLSGKIQTKPVYEFLKRCMDVTGAALGLMMLLPVLCVVSVMIKLDSPGPVFFVQKRTGHRGKVFSMYKFRSMCPDAEKMRNQYLDQNEADGPIFKMTHDPRVTKVGKWIRKTSVDELPQLWNVLNGTMSLVGPRPLPTYEQAECTEEQAKRLLVKPGMTGMWQTNGRSDTSFEEMIALDLQYIERRSLWTDLKIIWATFGSVFGKGAY
ncbi:MAG: sugar transferase [Massiliimalia sp.]|jgi:lipopolysaccharide/colanic/teichoic acid biosynthesis glycosyltransferase